MTPIRRWRMLPDGVRRAENASTIGQAENKEVPAPQQKSRISAANAADGLLRGKS